MFFGKPLCVELECYAPLMLLVCWTVSAWPGKIRRHMATLIALGRVFVCALFSSKQSCESAGSLGKANLAAADSSKLITAEELRSVSSAVSHFSGSGFSV